MKKTDVPAQIEVPWADAIVTVGGVTAFTVIEIAVLLALTGLGQAALLVTIQLTLSPFKSELVV